MHCAPSSDKGGSDCLAKLARAAAARGGAGIYELDRKSDRGRRELDPGSEMLGKAHRDGLLSVFQLFVTV